MEYKVIHNREEHRFEVSEGGATAIVEYQLLENRVMKIYHTEVPEPIQGKGIGSALVKEAIDYAWNHHYQVLPTCPFAREYLLKHSRYKEILS